MVVTVVMNERCGGSAAVNTGGRQRPRRATRTRNLRADGIHQVVRYRDAERHTDADDRGHLEVAQYRLELGAAHRGPRPRNRRIMRSSGAGVEVDRRDRISSPVVIRR